MTAPIILAASSVIVDTVLVGQIVNDVEPFLHKTAKRGRLMHSRSFYNAGFTLIELLIVVAIIGILAAVAIPQFSSYRARAFNTAATTDIKNFKTEMEGYYYDNTQYPSF